ncbi:dTDP-4-dehydrorhamnose reductase [Pedobacter sp. SYSU D00535]|uniref:dTDP-4-dehydrorhamnose reductase n=1 Tax=Pedobacter sp. SYSU D00535 TaxID=2810308 RepID=UPI001A977ADC|nr:dTDP-4-dehydrorhamnose reductase [Pedobacter sp. SYSU D00535]
MKRILVTGSNGLLGQKLTDLLLTRSEISLIASSKGPNRHPVARGYIYVDLDLSDKSRLETAITTHRPDVIINTAAITNVDSCHKERDLCWKINVESVSHLAALCREYAIHLIHLSTDFVFDGEEGPYREEDQPNPLSFYGESKLAAERLVQDSGCRYTIVRTILVYGITAQMSRSNIVLWVKQSLEAGKQIQVVDDQFRMPTLAEDLAAACLAIAEQEATGIYHISGKDMLSVLEIALQVADFWKLDKSLITSVSSGTLNQEAKRPLKTGFVLNKAIRDIHYQPHSFQEGLALLDQQLKEGGYL